MSIFICIIFEDIFDIHIYADFFYIKFLYKIYFIYIIIIHRYYVLLFELCVLLCNFLNSIFEIYAFQHNIEKPVKNWLFWDTLKMTFTKLTSMEMVDFRPLR